MNRWERRGWERGLDEGRIEGRTEGRQELLLSLLSQQCGPLSPETERQVRALPEARLAALGRALLRFAGPGDLASWLAEHAPADR
jgi:predicted transposase YdaD